MESFFEKIGGRKFIFSLVALIVGTVVELKTERGISANFVALLVGVSGAFITGNALVTNKAISSGLGDGAPSNEGAEPNAVSQDDIAEMKAQLSKSSELLENVGASVANVQKMAAAILKGTNL